MPEHNLVAVSFAGNSEAYEALSKLGEAEQAGRVDVVSAGIVERDAAGNLSIPEGDDRMIGGGALGGGLVGLLVGIIGGPVGVLFGWGAGALIGGAADLQRSDDAEDLVLEFSQVIPPGGNALVAELDERNPEVFDELMSGMGGTVVRRPAEEVLAEMEAAQDAAEAAGREAREQRREQKKQERKGNYEERKARVKAKLKRD